MLSPPRRRARLIHRGSLWLSLSLHLVGLFLVVTFVRLGPRFEPGSADAPAGERVEYIDLAFPGSGVPAQPSPPTEAATAPVPATALPRARRPEEERLAFPTAPAPAAAGAASAGSTPGGTGAAGGSEAATGGGAAGGGGGVSDRLRPGFRDPRLYVDPRIEALKKTDTRSDHQRYMAHLEERIRASNDSAWAQGSHPDTDWTVKDRQGRKWGLSEDGLHLGGVTIDKKLLPRPRATGTNQKQEEAREKERQRLEIQAQEEARARRKAQEEQIRETRERKEQERRAKGGGGGG